jgi:hypothetical protein
LLVSRDRKACPAWLVLKDRPASLAREATREPLARRAWLAWLDRRAFPAWQARRATLVSVVQLVRLERLARKESKESKALRVQLAQRVIAAMSGRKAWREPREASARRDRLAVRHLRRHRHQT